ncbi:unnamed protein product [Plutella xylostella]|uniref:(diamondback moth) hypothetical protein n=1 Tax=Plutella xylostella TaxID=51655 RepID=A0A8S4FNV5_PLUXY|nr:ATP-binding cassette subfamily G member 4 [Plutella xylostella]CAG9129147.1 unnamed protein product [Plutella xylostella]
MFVVSTESDKMVCGTDNTGSESQDTNSTSVLEESINIAFQDIHYSVRNGFFTRGHKQILAGVCGEVAAGELTVLVGQSGAGKSTLMDILAGYTAPTSGQLLVNGRLRDDKWFRRRSCYIMQNDQLQDMLTVEESLNVACDLKLGAHVSREQKCRRVVEIVSALGLCSARVTQTRSLSGGERKRLAIGLELVSDPPVMFLDEPTSGLDSSMSKQIIYLLQLLARQGRTVVITLHQPSAVLLQMIDRLYGMVGGRCAYMGSVPMLLPFLEGMNLKSPPFHNPVDFFIEMMLENTNLFVRSAQNGKNTQWIANIPHVSPQINNEDDLIGKSNLNLYEEIISITALPPPKEDETSKTLLKLKTTYSTSSWTQFCTLTRRSLLILWRHPTYTRMILAVHCVVAVFIGSLFYDIGGDAMYVRDNYNFLYFSLMFLMFTAFSSVSISFPQELPVIRREHFNRWYTSGAYYSATVAASIPTQTLCTLAYACITYYMTGQPQQWLRFLGFSWTLMHVSYVALCLGLLNGSLFDVKSAVVFGPFFIMPFTIFSGFFLRYVDAPGFFKWLFHVSFLKHGLVGLVLSIFGMDRGKLPCSDIYCHYSYPKQFIEDQGCSKESYHVAVTMLFCTFVVVILSTYVILKFRLSRKW